MQYQMGLCAVAIALSGFSLGLATAPKAWADPVDNYAGLGVRGGFNDDVAVVLGAKVKIADFGELSLSGRPAILIGNKTEFRVALTGEGEVSPDLSPYFGGGLAVNTKGSDDIAPLVTAGLDFRMTEQVVVQVGGNFIFADGDTDTELTATVNYAF